MANERKWEGARTALVTGAAGGIGRATVQMLAAQGWHVVGVDRRPCADDGHGAVRFIREDIAEQDGLERVFEQVHQLTDHLNALVNNAAIQFAKPLVETTAEEWDRLMAVNVRAAFVAVRGLHPLLKKCKGSVVNVSSVHAVATSKEIGAYAASKGALLALTRAMAVEFAADGIRVNAVLPGAVDTSMLRAGLCRDHAGTGSIEDRLDNLARRTVIGRVGVPTEIAHAIVFLADNEQSSFITGQPFVVDGGATAKLSTE